jgi:hypothetical protein
MSCKTSFIAFVLLVMRISELKIFCRVPQVRVPGIKFWCRPLRSLLRLGNLENLIFPQPLSHDLFAA